MRQLAATASWPCPRRPTPRRAPDEHDQTGRRAVRGIRSSFSDRLSFGWWQSREVICALARILTCSAGSNAKRVPIARSTNSCDAFRTEQHLGPLTSRSARSTASMIVMTTNHQSKSGLENPPRIIERAVAGRLCSFLLRCVRRAEEATPATALPSFDMHLHPRSFEMTSVIWISR